MSFIEKWKKKKGHSEINWPLIIQNFSHFSETLLPDDAKPLLIVDEARLQGNNFCAFAYQRTDALGNVWPAQMGIDLSKPWLVFVSEYKFVSLILLIPKLI